MKKRPKLRPNHSSSQDAAARATVRLIVKYAGEDWDTRCDIAMAVMQACIGVISAELYSIHSDDFRRFHSELDGACADIYNRHLRMLGEKN